MVSVRTLSVVVQGMEGELWGPLGLAEGAWQENVIDRPEAGRLAGRVGTATAPEP